MYEWTHYIQTIVTKTQLEQTNIRIFLISYSKQNQSNIIVSILETMQ